MSLLADNPNYFARSPLDRAAHRRRDAAWLTQALQDEQTRLIPFCDKRPFVTEEGGVASAGWLGAHARASIAPQEALLIFLGVDKEGAPHFAIDIPSETPLADIGRFDDLRALLPRLARDDSAILGCAKSIYEWHARHRYCANCGAPSAPVEAGWKRECASCKAEHFPRFDPVVIMVPTFGDICALGRQKPWPRGMHSALAGFVEPGETIEEAVARETLEEAGLRVRSIRLHSSQPWPFPHSLMMGALAEVENEDIAIDGHELESARWFTREEARQLIAGKHPECSAPPQFAIAHQILKTWAEQ